MLEELEMKYLTENFEALKGLKQSNPVFSALFSYVFEYTMKKAKTNRTGLYHKIQQCLAFSKSKQELRDVLLRLE